MAGFKSNLDRQWVTLISHILGLFMPIDSRKLQVKVIMVLTMTFLLLSIQNYLKFEETLTTKSGGKQRIAKRRTSLNTQTFLA